MEVSLNIPDNIATLLQTNGESLSRIALEALAIEGYSSGKLSERNVMDLLGISSQEELYEFFKAHDVRQPYTLEDFEKENDAMAVNAGSRLAPGQPTSLEEFERDMDALAEGTEHLPPSTITYAREDIYFDHD